jgi:peptide/nickel transport system permease protein
MLNFLQGKGVQYAFVLLLTLLLNFSLPRLMPGSPLQFLAGEDVAYLTQAQRTALLAKHGLDQPIPVQFVQYLGQVVRLDLGHSFQLRRPVIDVIKDRLPWTILLMGSALLISSLIGVLLGALAAWRRGGRSDMATLILFIFLESLPSFWVGMMLVATLAAGFNWFPIFGAYSSISGYTGFKFAMDVAHHMALPLLTLVIVGVSGHFMIMRYSMLSVLGEDYILMARAKGLKERVILYHHALRNALLPVATVIMLSLGFVVSGATVVETVFSIPGLGRLMYEAVLGRDYPLMQGAFLIVTISVIAMNIVADLIYPLLDPRVGRGQAHGS